MIQIQNINGNIIHVYKELTELIGSYTIKDMINYEVYSTIYNEEFVSEIAYENNKINLIELKDYFKNEISISTNGEIVNVDNNLINEIIEDVINIKDYAIYKMEKDSLYDFDGSLVGIGFIIFNKNKPYKILIFGGSD